VGRLRRAKCSIPLLLRQKIGNCLRVYLLGNRIIIYLVPLIFFAPLLWAAAPTITTQPNVEGVFSIGETLELRVLAEGDPAPEISWEKDGETIEGTSGSRLYIKRLAPYDGGTYRARVVNADGEVLSDEVVVEVEIELAAHSPARWWDEFMLEAIRKDFPDPTKHGRNLYHVSAALWDSFWPYELEAWTMASPVFHREDVDPGSLGGSREDSQREAMSHAAFTVLMKRYQDSPGADRSLFGFRWLMEQYGFDPDFTGIDGDSPAAVGNRIGNAILEGNYEDGSNELNGYEDTSGYREANEPLFIDLSGTQVNDINRWQPIAFEFAISQNGIPLGSLVQTFLGVNWREVETFALEKTRFNTIAIDPGGPPLFQGETKEEFREAVAEVIRYSSYLDPNDTKTIDVSPGARLNNSLGTNDGTGRGLNPVTGESYAPNLVKLADYGRILAEFWADGPASETPPGHWNTLHNEISDNPLFERRYMGQGEELSKLEWDVRAYLALNGGMHDAAVAAWTLKRQYDYSRPITMIRHLGENGQSSDPESLNYSSNGLPLIPGLIEVITEESAAPGQRHAHLFRNFFDYGKVVILSWAGVPDDPHSEVGGVDWIFPQDWMPYQRSTFVTPAFPAYVSGHSTFSRAGAEIMTLLTGSPFFPGGLGEFHFPKNSFLEFEAGPSEDLTLQWATYYDAADQAGISRLYGGIHVRADDLVGRRLGARIGAEAFIKAHTLRNAKLGTGWLRDVSIRSDASLEHGTSLALFDVSGTTLPFRKLESLSSIETQEPESIYFEEVKSNDGYGRTYLNIGSLSESIKGVEALSRIEDGETISVEISIDSLEPTLILASARYSSGKNAALEAYRYNGDEWELIERNDDWLEDDRSSLSSSLLMRRSDLARLGSGDAGMVLMLEEGTYRFIGYGSGSRELLRVGVFGH
jgi:hypothetical protein